MTEAAWTRPQQVIEALRRKWTSGQYLASAAQGQDFEPIGAPLKGPAAADVLHHYEQVLAWAQSWAPDRHPQLRIQTKTVGGRGGIPANPVPERVWVDTREHLWSLLGVAAEVELFHALHEQTVQRDPVLAQWMQDQPMKVLRNTGHWLRLVETTCWIRDHTTVELYLRQIDVPGVDTKFIENNKGILSELLDRSLPHDRIHIGAPRSDFAARYGFLRKPAYIRLRHLGSAPGPFSEFAVRATELTSKPAGIRTVFVLENEVTYLSLPPMPDAIAILGSGYAAALLRHLPWLADVDLHYWGDIDTHGFAILSQVRARFPHTRSLLMDTATLLAHQEHWGEERSQTLESPRHLSKAEAQLEQGLRDGTHRPHLRLEQERIPIRTIVRALEAVRNDDA
ncbi:Wadjet anti-phage system protein JetD domain-containing protein [Streptomyces sp. NPDC098789]|uniref:Wadjet anti-phage system protein JetD domain-containing protein n=1 Tax=Streptomyces sp. NPDC098789 TaxID=3366098 RepID=UPI00381F16E7